MPLPPPFDALVADRRFWTDAYWLNFDADRYEELDESAVIEFSVTEQHRLMLTFSNYLDYFELALSANGGKPRLLGWDDLAHFHPHVFRWTELAGVSHAIARSDPSLPHPGVPLLLLARFAPITNADDARLAWHLMRGAWDRLGLLAERERVAIFDHLDRRGAGFVWSDSERGLVLTQAEEDRPSLRAVVYTLRSPSNDEFPHDELAELSATCPSPSTVSDDVEPPTPLSRLNLEIAVGPKLLEMAARFLALFMNRALHDSVDGSAQVSGLSTRGDGVPISRSITIAGRGAPSFVAEQAVDLLRVARALPFARFTFREPVSMDSPPASRCYVQLMNLVIERGSDWPRFDRPALTSDQRDTLDRALREHGFTPPDERDLRVVVGPGGERIEVLFPAPEADEDLDGVSVWLTEINTWTAALVHALATSASLFLYPPLVASTVELARAVEAPWPGVHVAKSWRELLPLLARAQNS